MKINKPTSILLAVVLSVAGNAFGVLVGDWVVKFSALGVHGFAITTGLSLRG